MNTPQPPQTQRLKTLRYYTGIGSRQTPPDVQERMGLIAKELAKRNYTLRSGHAQGADRAFENGANGRAVIYLPWASFGIKPHKEDPGCPVKGLAVTLPNRELVERYGRLVDHEIRHVGDSTPHSSKLLHGRNYCQVMGHLLTCPPSLFVVCWTHTGLEGYKGYDLHNPKGGTATAILLADMHDIPVFNLKNSNAEERLWTLVDNLGAY